MIKILARSKPIKMIEETLTDGSSVFAVVFTGKYSRVQIDMDSERSALDLFNLLSLRLTGIDAEVF